MARKASSWSGARGGAQACGEALGAFTAEPPVLRWYSSVGQHGVHKGTVCCIPSVFQYTSALDCTCRSTTSTVTKVTESTDALATVRAALEQYRDIERVHSRPMNTQEQLGAGIVHYD